MLEKSLQNIIGNIKLKFIVLKTYASISSFLKQKLFDISVALFLVQKNSGKKQ
jgi:hypothetical protein